MLRLTVQRLPRAFALLAAVAWLWSSSAAEVHHLVVKHVVCAEHGELSEVHSGPAASADHGDPSIVADQTDHPDHGCASLALATDRAPPVLGMPRITRAGLKLADPLTTPAAPRGPPLDYAPKTSPPRIG